MRIAASLALATTLSLATALAANNAPAKFSGEAVIRGIGTNRIAVLLDSNGDRKVDHGFLLSSDLPVAGDLAVRCPVASIAFTDGWTRVESDKKVWNLHVAGYPEPPAAGADVESHTYVGYALVHSTGASGCDLDRALSDATACYRYGED